jgi:hypothetical protein
MLDNVLDLIVVIFGNLNYKLGYIASFAIPICDKVFGLVHPPVFEIVMILNPVFAEFGVHRLSGCRSSQNAEDDRDNSFQHKQSLLMNVDT